MNFKKTLAAIAAGALAVSAMAVSSFAAGGATTASFAGDYPTGTIFDDGGWYKMMLLNNNDAAATCLPEGIDYKTIAGVKVQMTFDLGTEGWAGGGIVFCSNGSNGWAQKEFTSAADDANADKIYVESGVMSEAVIFTEGSPFADASEYALFCFQTWDNSVPVEITAIEAVDVDGNTLFALPAPAPAETEAPADSEPADSEPAETEAPADSEPAETDASAGDTNTTTTDKTNSDTGVEGVAAIAGLAIVATGAVVVAKKRK